MPVRLVTPVMLEMVIRLGMPVRLEGPIAGEMAAKPAWPIALGKLARLIAARMLVAVGSRVMLVGLIAPGMGFVSRTAAMLIVLGVGPARQRARGMAVRMPGKRG